jgi:hypothetical protein
MIKIKKIFNKRLSRFEFLDMKKSQSKRTLDVGLFTFGIVCAVFLLGLVLLLCLTRSEESSTIVRRRPITFSPDLGQFPLSIENNNFNDNIELGIVHEEGTDNNLDNNINSTSALIETVQEQNEISSDINSTAALIETVQEQNEISSDDEEFFQGALDELIDFTRQEMRRQDEMIELLENILAKE